jgi:hypothetical protein
MVTKINNKMIGANTDANAALWVQQDVGVVL